MTPKSSLHLQFAYYESAIAVEFLVERYGFNTLNSVLKDLAAGLPINLALDRHTDGLARIEEEFEQFARDRAQQLGPKVDWERHDLTSVLTTDDETAFADWLNDHPNSFFGLMRHADQLVEDKKWKAAQSPLKNLIELYPDYTGPDNSHEKLARVYRELNEPVKERSILEQYARIDAAALRVLLRLLELDQAAEDWPSVVRNAEQAINVNPLIPQPYRALAMASEKLSSIEPAISAYEALLVLAPDDPAEVHYRLARLLHERKDAAAKRHVLFALEEAPRFRAALKLLLAIRAAQLASTAEVDPGGSLKQTNRNINKLK